MSRSTLLPLLSDGEFHSGQALADALGVSRTAVWKQVTRLNSQSGPEIETVRGKGYRIPGGLDLLHTDQVNAALNERARTLLSRLEIRESIDSTNTEILRLAEQGGAASGLVCAAEQQTAGRGRRGRQWVSPYGSNLYLSLLWEFSQGAAALEGLSLAVGVAVARALGACGVPSVQLKWPNDILCRSAKLGGILLEMSGDAAGPCRVVIGVGLNVAMPDAAAQHIDQAWTDLKSLCARPPGRNQLLAALLNELLPLLANFEQRGFSDWRDEWLSLDAFANVPVVLNTGAAHLSGVARGVDERGALRLETDRGIESVYGGEISLRAAT